MYTLPGIEPVFTFKELNAVLILDCNPVKLILVKFNHEEYPVLNEIPVVDVNDNVVLDGGFTNPIVTNKVVLVLKLDNENPLAFWLDKFCKKFVADGDVILCEKRNIGDKIKKHRNINFFID
jgi:hypothetical protein